MRGISAHRASARGLLVAAVAVLSLAFASTASADSFIVLYKGNAVPVSAKTDVEKAGGRFVYGYDAIGVAIARSNRASFAAALSKGNRVEGVSSTARFASRLDDPQGESGAEGPPPGDLPNAPAGDFGQPLPVAVGHAPDPHAPGARDHGWQPFGARGRHRHGAGLPSSRPAPER